MFDNLPGGVVKAAALLPAPLYLVGGYVRNALLGIRGGDVDAAGGMPPEVLAGCLPSSQFAFGVINRRLGTVAVVDRQSGESFEYTAFRREEYPEGGAHVPASVTFTQSLNEDARRRDFTANAIYYDVSNAKLLDPLGGERDIARRLLRAEEPERVFADDGLRILRLARQAAELGFSVGEATAAAARSLCANLADISPERIREELDRILAADGKYPGLTLGSHPHVAGIELLDSLGALRYVFPELEAGKGMAQRRDFHRYDVFRHTLETLRHSPPRIRLASLLHDIAKPAVFNETGRFYGHEERGAAMAREILRRLRYPNRTIERVSRLVGLHMYDLNGSARESKVRLKLAENWDIAEDLLELKQADYLGCGLFSGESPTVEKWRRIREGMLADGTPLNPAQLRIGGRELVAMGYRGRQIARARALLWQAAVKAPELNASPEKLERWLAGNFPPREEG